jgi:hypothetical protein
LSHLTARAPLPKLSTLSTGIELLETRWSSPRVHHYAHPCASDFNRTRSNPKYFFSPGNLLTEKNYQCLAGLTPQQIKVVLKVFEAIKKNSIDILRKIEIYDDKNRTEECKNDFRNRRSEV